MKAARAAPLVQPAAAAVIAMMRLTELMRLRGGGDDESEESEPEEEPDEEEEEEGAGEEEEEAAARGGDGDAPEWAGSAAPDFDDHMDQRMQLRYDSNDNPSVKNAGELYAKMRAGPKAPLNGWYDERHRCETLRMDEIDEERDFEFILGNRLEGIGPPDRVCLSFKGLEDQMIEMLARFLDETSTRYGDQIKAWREEGNFGCKFLYLNDNPITDAGAAYLADALKNNHTVKELYLQYTNVGDKGVAHFLEMLKVNTTLQKLELGCTGITEQGGKAIIKAFSPGGVAVPNKTLEHLGLFSNDDAMDDDLPTIYDFLEKESRDKR